jgi:hypothetical protein
VRVRDRVVEEIWYPSVEELKQRKTEGRRYLYEILLLRHSTDVERRRVVGFPIWNVDVRYWLRQFEIVNRADVALLLPDAATQFRRTRRCIGSLGDSADRSDEVGGVMHDELTHAELADVGVMSDAAAALDLLRCPDVATVPFGTVGVALIHPPEPVEGEDFEIQALEVTDRFGGIELVMTQRLAVRCEPIGDADNRLRVVEPAVVAKDVRRGC